jgi:hypothetical protein
VVLGTVCTLCTPLNPAAALMLKKSPIPKTPKPLIN